MRFEPPVHWQRITMIDAHTAGEPLRVITGGWPDIPGETMLAKRQYAREHLDRLRRALMLEPRGHADMYGCILTPPVTRDGEADQSPTGTGVSGRAAIRHARGELGVDETITIESLIGTHFDVRVVEATAVGACPAVIPEVTGAAYITGRHEFFIDLDDSLKEGVLLR